MIPIIKSRWETDAYKLSMGQAFWQLFRNVDAIYRFVDRNNMVYPDGFAEKLREQVDSMASLPPNADRAEYLKQKWPFINKDFLKWFTNEFRHDPKQVKIDLAGGRLSIEVIGPMYTATHWEIPLLRMVSCLYTRMSCMKPQVTWHQEMANRAWFFQNKGIAWAEFGGRRPFSPDVHFDALASSVPFKQSKKGEGGLIGTSWVEYAFQLGLMPIGTQAHEYTSLMGGVYGHANANEKALEIWVKTFGTRLGYVLPDTYSTQNFLKVFTHGYADLFEGSRQDSGDPFKYADMLVAHYEKVDVDPRSKSIIHSDSLRDEDKIVALNEYRKGQYLRSFGLGGIITNNVGHPPFNIIAKLFGIRIGDKVIPTVKISDNAGKAVGLTSEVEKVIRDLNISY